VDDNVNARQDRRGFLMLGGAAGAAVLLAACGSDDDAGPASATTTTSAPPSARDVTLLRTASSIEELEVEIYKRGIDGGLFTSPGMADAAKLLQSQHDEHGALFQGHTTRLGGEPFTQPNPALLQQFQSRIAAATNEGALLRLLFDIAQAAAATYQAAVTNVDDDGLNLLLMSVAGVEARHAAYLGGMLNQPVPAGSFATTAGAVAPGTGVG